MTPVCPTRKAAERREVGRIAARLGVKEERRDEMYRDEGKGEREREGGREESRGEADCECSEV